MPATLAIKPVDLAPVEVVKVTRGLLQLSKEESVWTCNTVLYGSSTTFAPMELTQQKLVDLFQVCRIEDEVPVDNKHIVEFAHTDVSVETLKDFGFRS